MKLIVIDGHLLYVCMQEWFTDFCNQAIKSFLVLLVLGMCEHTIVLAHCSKGQNNAAVLHLACHVSMLRF